MAPTEAAPIPVTVVTGFLGAGKTTLVNHILTSNHGKKVAVIENEFGEVGIDDALVVESKDEIYEMNNGCICCTVRGDLIRTLQKLLKRKNKFDAIMIETTGLANPAPVIQTFFVDEEIKAACKLDAVLTVVDAKHVMMHLDEEKPDGVVNEAVQQIAFADKVLLNKIDLINEDEKQEVIARIQHINKPVEIIECQQSKVDVSKLLGINAFSLDKLLEMDPEFLEDGEHGHSHDHGHPDHKCDDHCDHHHDHHDHKHDHDHHHHHDHDHKCDEHCDHDHDHDHEHKEGGKKKKGHLHHVHDDRVTSVGIQAEGDCNMEKLNAWLSKLLQEKGVDLFRSKGILSVAGSDEKHVFQGVHMLLMFSNSSNGIGRPWRPDEKRINKIVFIGKNLDRKALTDSFLACITQPGEAAAEEK